MVRVGNQTFPCQRLIAKKASGGMEDSYEEQKEKKKERTMTRYGDGGLSDVI